jgi:hypothetical protein
VYTYINETEVPELKKPKGFTEMTTTNNNNQVTEAQLNATHRVVDLTNKCVFFLVENSRGLVNDEGEIIEYKVKYDRNHHIIRCLPFNGPACPASEKGLTCWHMKAARQAAENFKAELKLKIEEQEKTLREIESDDRAMWLETSSSLDGLYYEVCPASGRVVPMR